MLGVIRLGKAVVPVSKGNFCAVSIEPLIVVAVLLLVTYIQSISTIVSSTIVFILAKSRNSQTSTIVAIFK